MSDSQSMNDTSVEQPGSRPEGRRFGCLQVLAIVIVVALITALLVGWWVKRYIYASEFRPTTLSKKEQVVLDSKLEALKESAEKNHRTGRQKPHDRDEPLKPEAYSEEGARREISLTEKELNALIANKPEVARRVAVDLSDNLVSVKLVIPVDEDIIVLGGKTLRLNLGVILDYEKGQPVVALKGVSIGGVPLPNAWLGYLKNRNLVDEFGSEGGFWQLFAEGVRDIKVKRGHLEIRLRE